MWSVALLLATVEQPSETQCLADEACEIRLPISARAADALLSSRTEAWWVHQDILTVIARRDGEASLCCAIERHLHPIGDGLQSVSVRIPDIETAIIDIAVVPLARQEIGAAWRGPAAPPPPERSDPSALSIFTHQINSDRLGAPRIVQVYVPPGIATGARVPVIYMADGLWPGLAQIADAAIRQGRSAPVIIVGIANPPRNRAPECPETRCNLRNQELLIDIPGAGPEQARFDAFAHFVLDDVISFVEAHYPALQSRDRRAVMGRSSGGAWALTMASRYPEIFGNIIALSIGWAPAAQSAANLRHGRLLIAAGRLENARFREQTAAAERLARAAGAEVRALNLNAGHDFGLWDIAFAEALMWMFPPDADD